MVGVTVAPGMGSAVLAGVDSVVAVAVGDSDVGATDSSAAGIRTAAATAPRDLVRNLMRGPYGNEVIRRV